MKADTDPNIAHLIITALTAWRIGDNISGNSIFLHDLVEWQELIGWQGFFEGWLIQAWARVQQSYYDLIHSRKTGRCWVIALIQKLWDIAWDLWEHCNGILHRTGSALTMSTIRKINRNVTQTFNDLHQCSLSDNNKHLVKVPLCILIKKDIPYKLEWLRIARLTLGNRRRLRWSSSTIDGRQLQGMQRNLRKWLNNDLDTQLRT
jgi:hypothetical protein